MQFFNEKYKYGKFRIAKIHRKSPIVIHETAEYAKIKEKKCNDTKKAEYYFKERGLKYQFIDMKKKGMSKGEFTSIAQANGGLERMEIRSTIL